MCIRDSLHTGDLIGADTQLGGPGDGISPLQGVEISKVVPHPPVVSGDGAVSIPDAGAFEMSRALHELSLIHI